MRFETRAIAQLLAFVHIGLSLAQTPPGFSPSTETLLNVRIAGVPVTPSSSVALDKTTQPPIFDFTGAEQTSSHVLVMVDLDAPYGASNNSLSPFLHWLLPLPAGVSKLSNGTEKMAVAPYILPAPRPGDGPHRYVLLLLRNPGLDFTMPPGFRSLNFTNLYNRALFNVEKFSKESNLQPVAATWFQTQNMASVKSDGSSINLQFITTTMSVAMAFLSLQFILGI